MTGPRSASGDKERGKGVAPSARTPGSRVTRVTSIDGVHLRGRPEPIPRTGRAEEVAVVLRPPGSLFQRVEEAVVDPLALRL